MLYHQAIDIGAYILSLEEKPIEPKSARIILTGTEDKLVGVGMSIEFRLRDLNMIIGSLLKRTTEVSEEMVTWFTESLPLNRIIEISLNLNKNVFSQIEPSYYNCDTIDQFLKFKLQQRDMHPTLLNLDVYELCGLNVSGENIVDEEELKRDSVFSKDDTPDGYISLPDYLGIIFRLLFVQFGSSVKRSIVDLFSARR